MPTQLMILIYCKYMIILNSVILRATRERKKWPTKTCFFRASLPVYQHERNLSERFGIRWQLYTLRMQ